MKTRNQLPLRAKLTLAAAIALAAASSAQAGSATWTNGAGTNVLNTAGNWSAGGPPTASGDTATWNGTVAGNLALTYNAIFGASTLGTTIDITSSQAGSISIGSTNVGTTTTFALQNLTIANGAFSGVASGPGFFFGGGSGYDQMTFRNGSTGTPSNTLTNNSNKTAAFGSDVVFSCGGGVGHALFFAGTGNWEVNSNLTVTGSGSFSVTKQDAGTLTLATNNTYGGLTTVTGGALNVGSAGSLASGNALTLASGGTADFANAGQTLGAVSNSNTATNALNFSASTGTVTLGSLAGAGNTRFGSNGTVTGGISTGTVNAIGLLTASISGGTVGAGSLSSTSVSGGATTVSGVATITTMSAGTANLNGATSAITTLSGGTVNLGTTVLTVSNGTTSGSITGSGGSLKKDSGGTLTLSSGGTYNYGGGTEVAAGILAVNGNLSATSNAVTVNGGTLRGTGTIAGSVTVNSGGTLAPGNSPGNITSSSLTLADNANFDIEIDKSLTPKNDSVTLTGNISNALTITTGANLNLSLTGTLLLGDRFTLVDYNTTNGTWNGGLFNLGAGTSNLVDDSVFQFGSYDWRINYDDTMANMTTESYTDNGKFLTLTVVPEPTATALGLLALGGLLLRRRR